MIKNEGPFKESFLKSYSKLIDILFKRRSTTDEIIMLLFLVYWVWFALNVFMLPGQVHISPDGYVRFIPAVWKSFAQITIFVVSKFYLYLVTRIIYRRHLMKTEENTDDQ